MAMRVGGAAAARGRGATQRRPNGSGRATSCLAVVDGAADPIYAKDREGRFLLVERRDRQDLWRGPRRADRQARRRLSLTPDVARAAGEPPIGGSWRAAAPRYVEEQVHKRRRPADLPVVEGAVDPRRHGPRPDRRVAGHHRAQGRRSRPARPQRRAGNPGRGQDARDRKGGRPDPPDAEDRVDRPTDRRHRARLQQHAGHRHRQPRYRLSSARRAIRTRRAASSTTPERARRARRP